MAHALQISMTPEEFQKDAARGQYKIVRLVPIEKDNKLIYRIKSPVEAFERTAEEHQLSTALA
jgi:hypothetical protein